MRCHLHLCHLYSESSQTLATQLSLTAKEFENGHTFMWCLSEEFEVVVDLIWKETVSTRSISSGKFKEICKLPCLFPTPFLPAEPLLRRLF